MSEKRDERPASMSTLFHSAMIVTMDPKLRVYANGALFIKSDKIHAIGSSSHFLNQISAEAAEVIDLCDRILLPGIQLDHAARSSTEDHHLARLYEEVFRLQRIEVPNFGFEPCSHHVATRLEARSRHTQNARSNGKGGRRKEIWDEAGLGSAGFHTDSVVEINEGGLHDANLLPLSMHWPKHCRSGLNLPDLANIREQPEPR